MTEIMRSQGVEVAGEDYAANQKKELEDSAKEILGELLTDLLNSFLVSFHDKIPQQKFWEWIKNIAEKEMRNA